MMGLDLLVLGFVRNGLLFYIILYGDGEISGSSQLWLF